MKPKETIEKQLHLDINPQETIQPSLTTTVTQHQQRLGQVSTLPKLPLRELTNIYNKFQELEKRDKLSFIDQDILNRIVAILETDLDQVRKEFIQAQLTAADSVVQKSKIVNEKMAIPKTQYAMAVAIDTVKELKNVQPFLPNITHTLNFVIRQARTIENILNRCRGEWFVSEIEQSTEQSIHLEQLYANYKKYCAKHREIAVIKSVFAKHFLELANYFQIDPIKSRNKYGVFFRGIKFKSEIELAPIKENQNLDLPLE